MAPADDDTHLREVATAPVADNNRDRPKTWLYLASHGRTALNAAGALRGLLDPDLDQVGWSQAGWLAQAMAEFHPMLVVTSPLRRAVHTAEAVAAQNHVPVEVDDRLIDRDYGRWAGQPKETVEAQWGSVDEAPGVDPAVNVRTRALEAFGDIARRVEGRAVVVVSHDAVLQLTLTALNPALGDPDGLRQETGCFNVLECRGVHRRVVALNQVSGGPQRWRHSGLDIGLRT
jgi:broad specificity phosphatase PhoE